MLAALALALGALAILPATPAAASACDPGTVSIRWVGRGVTDTWFDRNNWFAIGGAGARLPGPTDNVCIPDQVPNITVTYDNPTTTAVKSIETHEGLDVSTGQLNLTDASSPSQISDLTVDGGKLGGAAALTATSTLDFTAGRITGNGVLTVGPSASMTIGPAGQRPSRVTSPWRGRCTGPAATWAPARARPCATTARSTSTSAPRGASRSTRGAARRRS